MIEEKRRKIMIPEHVYRELAAIGRTKDKTVDEIADDLLFMGMHDYLNYCAARNIQNKKSES